VLQLALSLLAALSQFFLAGLLALVGVFQLIQGGFRGLDATQSFLMAASLLLTGILVLPSAWYAMRRLAHPDEPLPAPRKVGWFLPTLLLVAFLPPALIFGNLIARNDRIAWLLLPVLNVLVTGLPIAWLVFISKRGLPGGSLQRQWGIFASGLVLGPSIILGVELLALIGIAMIGILIASTNQELLQELSLIASRLEYAQTNPQEWLNILTPLIKRPAVIAGILAFGAVIVPLIEEALKPIGLWLLAGRRLTPVEGFVGGLLSGAGFALFENLGNTSIGGETWAALAGARIATALLHILATSLTGWALGHAWSRGRYFRLAFIYALAVTLHGVWNGLGIASFLVAELSPNSTLLLDVEMITGLSLIGLSLLTGFNFAFLLTFARGLRHKQRLPDRLQAASTGEIVLPSEDQSINQIGYLTGNKEIDPDQPKLT